jgi:putative DNA primase/helicase
MDERHLSGKHTACPLCGGKDRFRFDDKDGGGTYICSGCGAGDGVQLAIAFTGRGFKEAAVEIERIAGNVQPTAAKIERSDGDKRAALNRVREGSRAIQHGDEVERYLHGRGLRLDTLPASIRLHPGLDYYEGGKPIGKFAAMLATVTSPTGQPVSIHRTYLQDARKAPVATQKKLMQGLPLAGAAIRLAPLSRTLGIAEGIETALAASELFNVPVWSCISASGIESFEPPEGVHEIVIFSDNDQNFAGQKAAYTAAHRLSIK